MATMDSHFYYKMAAYRKQHDCCETTLIRLVEDQKTTVDRKESVTELSTHMGTAFDLLHLALRIQKLTACGFSLNLMRSFLKLRGSQVKLKDQQSAWKEQTRGMPTGFSLCTFIKESFPKPSPFICGIREYFHVRRRPPNIYSIKTDVQELKSETEKVTQWYKVYLLNQRIFLCTETTIKYTPLGLNQNRCSRTKE